MARTFFSSRNGSIKKANPGEQSHKSLRFLQSFLLKQHKFSLACIFNEGEIENFICANWFNFCRDRLKMKFEKLTRNLKLISGSNQNLESFHSFFASIALATNIHCKGDFVIGKLSPSFPKFDLA